MNGFLESFLPILGKFRSYKIESVFLLIALSIGFVSLLMFFQDKKPASLQGVALEQTPEKKTIFVDIAGAIVSPGVYEVSSGARLKDVLILTGGLTDLADQEYFKRNFNLAQVLTDQIKIYIPTKMEIVQGDIPDKININQASAEELDTLPGVGSTTAQNIIQNRPYSSIEELLTKKVLKKNVYEKIKDIIEN